MRTFKYILFIVAASLILNGCVVKKKKSDVSGFKRAYHNMTAYYNAYFHAEELVEESLYNMRESHLDNYNDILDVYDYTALNNPKMEAENLDEAIKKVSTAAALHRESQWVDDCYVIIGRCQFYKQDYESAEETFLFFEEEFNPNNPYGSNYDSDKKRTTADRKRERKQKEKERAVEKKEKEKDKKERAKSRKEEQKERDKARKQAIKDRKKGKRTNSRSSSTPDPKPEEVKEKPIKEDKKEDKKEEESTDGIKNGPLKHIPAFYEGMYWLGRTLVEREQFSSAEFYFEEILKSNAKEEIKKKIPAARAHSAMKQGDYDKAINLLDNAIAESKSRSQKGRFSYIKAQINERKGNHSAAFAEYKKSRDYNPGFEMEFYSHLNEVKLSYNIDKISSKNAIGKLKRMGKETKYNTLQGPLHNAIGEILLQDGDLAGALEEFKLASSSAGSASTLDADYQLAKIYLDGEEYIQAKVYFDKAADVMTKSDPRYDEVKNYANNLTAIAKNIENINLQDSLLLLAEMPKDELYALARENIKNQPVVEEEELSPAEQLANKSFRGFGAARTNFFAYNPTSVDQGMNEFKREWGDVVLSDNWRTGEGDQFTAAFDDEDVEEELVISDAEVENYLKDVPNSVVQKEMARREIMEAKYNLGILYRDNMNEYDKSVDELTALLSEFPSFQNKEKTYFYLYLDHTDIGNKTQAQYYRNLLKKEFPDSEFTKIATDPNYAKKASEEANDLENYYKETYTLFEQEKHEQVLQKVSESTGLFGERNDYSAKFALLQALSVGNVSGKDDYVQALNNVSKNYPNTPESIKAREILLFFKGNGDAFNGIINNEASKDFTIDDDMLHYNMVVVYGLSSNEIDILKTQISGFNNKFFQASKLSSLDLGLNKDKRSSLILIRKFSNREKAMEYYNITLKTKEEFIQTPNYEIFPINQRNYREVIKQRSVEQYRAFFEQEYLGN